MADFASGLFVEPTDLNPVTFDTGDVKWSARRTASDGWLKCDGSAVARDTYADLFAEIAPTVGTVTVTVASPGVFTHTAHGLAVGDTVYLTTTGALPTGLAANTLYYVVSVPDANTFTVSATSGGSAINTSGTQSGTHTLHLCPYGLGNGSTTFNLPDVQGRTLVASAGAGGHADVTRLSATDGVALQYRRPKHRHTTAVMPSGVYGRQPGSSVSDSGDTGGANATGPATIGVTVGADATNDPLDAPAYMVLNLFIKT